MGHPTNSHIKNSVDTGNEEILKAISELKEKWEKHVNITELLGIDLKCPHCNEILKINEKGRTYPVNRKSAD